MGSKFIFLSFISPDVCRVLRLTGFALLDFQFSHKYQWQAVQFLLSLIGRKEEGSKEVNIRLYPYAIDQTTVKSSHLALRDTGMVAVSKLATN
jgi:hypothetical protein